MPSQFNRRDLVRLLSAGVGVSVASGGWNSTFASSNTSVSSSPIRAQEGGGTLNVAIFGEPATLDYMQQGDMAATIMDWNIYDQLARWNYETSSLDAELATEWSQETDTTWTVKLREGVQFHKGYGEVTADDVAFSVNYILENDARIKFLYGNVESVDVVDTYTLRYNLTEPSTPFVQSSIQGFGGLVLSRKAFEELGPEAFARTPVGTGPFEVEQWSVGDRLTLKGFAEYWDADFPKVDTVNVQFVPDPTVKLSLLSTGQVDIIDSVPYDQIASLQENADLVIQTVPGWNWDFISFGNHEGVFADKRVRQAISYAIDRQSLVDAVYYGHAIPAEKPLPPGFMFRDDSITKFTPNADIETAKQLLADAGMADGFTVPGYAPSDKAPVTRAAQIIAQMLAEIGITLELQFLDNASYTAAARSEIGDYLDFNQITIMSPDPDSAINWFWHTGGSLAHNYSNAEIDALLDQGKVAVDESERAEIYKQLQELMLDECWFIYTTHRELVRAMTPNVTGYQITPQDMDFRLKPVAKS